MNHNEGNYFVLLRAGDLEDGMHIRAHMKLWLYC